jgi:hypothetical protein
MSKKKKMGRPKLPKGEAREVFPLRLSAAERALYERASSEKGLSLPDWMRTTLTNASKT